MDCSRARTRDPDEWVELAPVFSRPLAEHVRRWVFRTAPDLTESIKWNMLCFSGRKLVCGLSACKAHASLMFSRGTELPDPRGLFSGGEMNTHIRSVRFTSVEELDWKALGRLLLAAVDLDQRPDIAPPPKTKREPLPLPPFFARALHGDRSARAGFEALSASCQREWIVWLSTAKREETQQRRLAEALAALARGRKWIDRKLR